MRYKATAMILVIAIAAAAAHAQGGFAFCAKPGMLVNAAQFGYKSDALFAGVGLEFASVGVSSKSSHTDSSYSYEYSSKVDVSVFLPQLAFRYFFSPTAAGEVRPYAAASVFYSLSSVRIQTTDGETTVRDTSAERTLGDVLNGNVGGTLGFGGEYFFSENFSLGGEFGCRALFGGVSDESSGYYSGTYKYDYNLGLGVVYTALGLNFYF